MTKVIDLDKKRAENMEKEAEQGRAFALVETRFHETSVGLIAGDLPIAFFPHPDADDRMIALRGLCMTRKTARQIAIALLEAAETDGTDGG